MAHIIEIPDELYERLLAFAREHHQTPEALFLAWAAQVTEQRGTGTWGTEPPPTAEELRASPLLQIAGSLSIGDRRLTSEFHEVLAEAIADDHAEQE